MTKQVFNKLVRDNIPDIIKANGGKPIYKKLASNDTYKALVNKLLEEYNEFIEADGQDKLYELADIYEVLESLTDWLCISPELLQEIRDEKNNRNGAFKDKIFLFKVEE